MNNIKIPMALSAAEAHIKLVQQPIYDLYRRYKEYRDSDKAEFFLKNPGEISALISNVCFALELLLKILNAQCLEKPPNTHNLKKLWSFVPKEIKEKVASEYSVEIAKRLKSDDLKTVTFDFLARLNNPRRETAENIDVAFRNIAESYEQWRYFYENMELGRDKRLVFNFAEASSITQSLHRTVVGFEGNTTVTMEIEPNK